MELAAQRGAGRFPGKASLLRSLAATLAGGTPGAAAAAATAVHAACELGGVPAPFPEALAQAAKTKGGVPDPTEPDMLIGMSQTAQGKYADAAQTFSAVNQPNPASARVVRLWTYFAKQKANPNAGATAANATK